MKKIQFAVETGLVRFATWLLPKLSRRAVLLLSRTLGAMACAVDCRGRAVAHENLRVVFAEEGITPCQIRRITLASYQNFARTFLDLFWSARLTRENYADLIRVSWENPADEEMARQRGAVWDTPHFGNFEFAGFVWGFRGFRMVIVAQDFKNPALTEIFKRLRAGSGHMVIPQQGAMLRLVKTLARKGHAAMLSDLNIRPGKTAAPLRCFDRIVSATTLHTSLSMRLGLPLMLVLCDPLADGTYRIEMGRPLEPADYASPGEMAQAVWDRFEQHIRQKPEAWLWMYKHWRYLPGTERDPRYPDYANPSRPFRTMAGDAP